MFSFKDWFNSYESSAFTRSRTAAALGLGPKIASPFSRSTPSADTVEKLLNDLEDKPKKKKKKKKNESSKPDYSFDNFFRKIIDTKKDIEKDIANAKSLEKELDQKEDDDDEEEEESHEEENSDIDKKKTEKNLDQNSGDN